MPELPDLESFKYYFNHHALNQNIQNVNCSAPMVLKNVENGDLNNYLSGKQFTKSSRRGKFLICEVSGGEKYLVLHFGMTGNLNYTKQEAPQEGLDKHTRLRFQFDNNKELRWINMRKFGKVYLVEEPEEVDLINELGPEPLDIKPNEFAELLSKYGNRNIKSFFMDQRVIAGIGNIYSDEILFRSLIDPNNKIKQINVEPKKLLENTKKVVKESSHLTIEEGNFDPEIWIIPHRNEDMNCPNNEEHSLVKEKVGRRSAIYCPVCQGD